MSGIESLGDLFRASQGANEKPAPQLTTQQLEGIRESLGARNVFPPGIVQKLFDEVIESRELAKQQQQAVKLVTTTKAGTTETTTTTMLSSDEIDSQQRKLRAVGVSLVVEPGLVKITCPTDSRSIDFAIAELLILRSMSIKPTE
jgi:hypothetical protein